MSTDIYTHGVSMKQLFLRKKITLPEWEFDIVVIVTLFIGTVFGIYAVLTGLFPDLFAAGDVSTEWDFATPGEYTLSDVSLIEVTGSGVRLKVREYAPDSNTTLLYHLNESSGLPVTDSSSNENTGAAIQDTWAAGALNGALSFNGVNQSITVPHSTSLALSQAHTLEAWVKFDENFTNASHSQQQTILDKGDYRLYFDQETGRVNYELAPNTSISWEQQGGNEIKGSWDLTGKRSISVIEGDDTHVYVGTGDQTAGDAEVWRWTISSSTWTKIGGDGINFGWTGAQYEEVNSMTILGSNLYVGLGNTAGDSEVWRWNGTSWTRIGGNSVNSSWTNVVERVLALTNDGTYLYAGLGVTATTDAHVWRLDPSAADLAWERIGGVGLNSSWNAGPEGVYSLVANNDYVYAGLGTNTNDGQVWRFDKAGGSWTQIGGNGAPSSGWAATGVELTPALALDGSTLYVGLGNTDGDAQVWRWSGSWTQVGGVSQWGAGYEAIRSLHVSGGNLYVGLGDNNTDARLWRYNISGASWTHLGGNESGVTGTWTTHNMLRDIYVDDGVVYAGLYISNNHGLLYRYQDSAWELIGGAHINDSWGFYGLETIETLTTAGGYLYAGTGNNAAGDALIWRFDGNEWLLVGGQGINESWAPNTYEIVNTMASYKGELYVGLGLTAGDGDVWKYDGNEWEQVGGDGLKSGWTTGIEHVLSLASDSNYLYAGMGITNNTDSMVWRWNGTTWEHIGGRPPGSTTAVYGSWTVNIERVNTLLATEEYVYAGLGQSAGDADVFRWNGSAWTQIGGDGINSSWAASLYEVVESMGVYRGQVYVGLGTTAGDAEVWRWNGTNAWTMIGGDGIKNSWDDNTYTRVRSFAAYNGHLYVTIGGAAGSGEVWRYNLATDLWTKVGGNSVNSSWGNTIEDVYALTTYRGKLFAGTGNTVNADAAVWSFGNSVFLQSNTSGFDTDWHHIAATYDGTAMKLFIDGILDSSTSAAMFLSNTGNPLQIGNNFGSDKNREAQGYFNGTIDEVRISSTARTSFITKPFTNTPQTVSPTTSVMHEDIKNWEGFLETLPTSPVGTLTYRLSSNNGSTWQYWDSSQWIPSASLAQANPATDVNTHIADFPIGTGGIIWQAILAGNGEQQVTLEQIEITATSDTTNPTAPSSLTALSASAGATLTTDTWYGHTNPEFTWPEADAIGGASDDSGAGVNGYYVYFGTDDTATPSTAGTFQPGTTFTASNLTSGQIYHLRIQTRDNAQNVSTVWYPFIYKYDNSAPNNPDGLSVSPSGYSGTNTYTFFWSSVGSDIGSEVAGYQYKTGASSGIFSDWSDTITETSITLTDIAYQENANLFYLRTVDNAGNVSSSTIQVTFYYAGQAPTAPQNLTVAPTGVSTTNAFSFTWDPPATYSGTQNEIRYCYTINTLPSSTTCTFTAPGVTALPQDAYANQPGANTLYLVARDNVGNINYDAYTSIAFTANTPAPGIPLNVEVVDISAKSTQSWKLALSWEAPQTNQTAVSSYQVYQSIDGETFTFASSTNGIAYIGTELQQTTYYYKIRACDNSNNCGAFTEPVFMYPDGRFTEPALLIGEPEISDITTRRAVISWMTDRNSDTRIRYGLASGDYFEEEPSNSNQKTHHELSLNNLTPGTRYFLVAKWTDEDGNIGTSDEFTFETTAAPTIKSVSVPSTTLSAALIQFTSINASGVSLYYGKGAVLGAAKSIDTSLAESTYTVLIDELEDGTAYSFRINSVDADGFEYDGTVFEFNTLPRPRISNMEIQEVRGTAQPSVTVRWETNVETTSVVSYYPTGSPNDALDRVNLTRTQGAHEQLVTALLPNTEYTLIARGVDSYGNETQSDPQVFTTSVDTRPPRITNLQVDTTIQRLQTDGVSLAQIIVTWNTDELATSQIEYGEGTGTTYAQKTQEDTNPKTNHSVVISGLSPSKVYHLRTASQDSAGNIGHSVDTVTITPKITSNALDLVISNLSEIFGFLRNL